MNLKNLTAIAVTLLLTACGGPPSRQEALSANYGEIPSESFTSKTIATYLKQALIDPDSLKLRCTPAKKGWVRDRGFSSPNYGYVVLCGVNSKNRMGGYTGESINAFLFNSNSGNLVLDNRSSGGVKELKQGSNYGFTE